jgi:hypothetical protein
MRNMFARDEEVNGVMRDVDVYLRELIYIYIESGIPKLGEEMDGLRGALTRW